MGSAGCCIDLYDDDDDDDATKSPLSTAKTSHDQAKREI